MTVGASLNSNLKKGKSKCSSCRENQGFEFELFETPPIQWKERGQLLDVEDEVQGRHGDEGTL